MDSSQPGYAPECVRLLELLDLPADGLHASAPVEWLGQGGASRAGSWLKGEFVHLEVGSRSARLHSVVLAPEEHASILDTLQPSLRFAGIELLPPPDSHQTALCFLYSADRLEALCSPTNYGVMGELRDVLPQGPDGPLLRQLLTEVQMLLHDHPVNVKREARGVPAANALWLSGLGEFAGLQPRSLPRIVSDDSYAKGLCRLHGHEAGPLPGSAKPLLSGEWPDLVVVSLDVSGDSAGELHAFEQNWLAPLTAALEKKHLQSLQLLLGSHLVRIDRAGLRRFWRRGPGLTGLS